MKKYSISLYPDLRGAEYSVFQDKLPWSPSQMLNITEKPENVTFFIFCVFRGGF